jgi:3-oxoacyl-[acyl-carrier-protein] synthase II
VLAITGRSMVTCLGDLDETFAALVRGHDGARPLLCGVPEKLNVRTGYHIDPAETATEWLLRCVTEAIADAGLDPAHGRIDVVVGTGLRELRRVERRHLDGSELPAHGLHFRQALRAAVPAVGQVHTLANACAASGYALALAADMITLGEADAVVAAGCDGMTESMLAIIGRVGEHPADMVRPFDIARGGALLGEGAAAVVLQREGRAHGYVRGVGLSCDASHETAPDQAGIVRAIRDAHDRARVGVEEIDLVLAHGTGTALNDPTEAAALTEVFGPDGPLVTGIKGAVGHTSGSASLMSGLVALEAMRTTVVPPVVGLRTPIDEAVKLKLVRTGDRVRQASRITQVNAFGFGGVNAVTILEAAPTEGET